jgi:maleylacetoacetate isomerase
LAEKGITPEYVHVGLLDGESDGKAHRSRNPFGYVPVLQLPTAQYGGAYLVESMAIIEWLDETFNSPPLIPGSPLERAHIRALCEYINAGTQPIANLNVLDMLSERFAADENQKNAWIQKFIEDGLGAYESLCCKRASGIKAGKASTVWSVGDNVTAADLFLIPQCYNAIRFGVNLAKFPTIERIWQVAQTYQLSSATHPDRFKP